MKRLICITILSAFLLTACSNKTGFEAQSKTTGFDGARVVTIQPHGNACSSMICTGLGAQWSSKKPDEALLLVNVFNDIQGITGAELNIDGQIYQLKINNQFTNFDSYAPSIENSEQPFLVKLDLVRKIVSSKRTWLRVHTTKGVLEDAVIDSGKDSKAYNALVRFLTEIDK